MKLVIFGPTGMIGSRILNEALSRGHSLTAITRDPSRFSVEHEKLAVVAGNVLDSASVSNLTANHDAVLSAIGTSGSSTEVIVKGEQCENVRSDFISQLPGHIPNKPRSKFPVFAFSK